jgi:hypothetical protein
MRTDCYFPVCGLQMSYLSFALSEHRKSLGLGASRITFQDSHWHHRHRHDRPSPYYKCRSNAFRVYTRYYCLMESSIQYMTIVFRVRPSSILSRTPNKHRKLYEVFHLYCGLNFQRVVSSIPDKVTGFLFSKVP